MLGSDTITENSLANARIERNGSKYKTILNYLLTICHILERTYMLNVCPFL